MTLVLAAFVLELCVLSTAAQNSEPSALFVGKNASDLFDRIRGQTADLAWALSLDARIEAADTREALTIGEEKGVAVVVWFDISSVDRVVIKAAEIATGKRFERRVELAGKKTKLSASTTAEATAMAVRSLLNALAGGADNRQSPGSSTNIASTPAPASGSRDQDAKLPATSSSESNPATTAAQLEKPPASSRSESRTKPAATRPEARASSTSSTAVEPSDAEDVAAAIEWQIAAGWCLVLDGLSPIGQHGPHLRIGLDLDRWQFALAGYITLPSAIRDDQLTIELQRFAFSASVGYGVIRGPEARLSSGIGAGILLVTRSTEVHTTGLTPTSGSLLDLLVLFWDTRFQWFPPWLDRIVGLEISLGLEILPEAATFGVETGDSVVDQKKLWIVQPRFSIALVLLGG
ncbi:MAG: hypothetical protein JXA30_08325 [Deltaproteobacteria bacterium]|nr:hypothetical protein [Deltaproteobacteria bacterium]